MYVGYSKEHEALRDELRAYYDKLLTPEVEDQLRGSEGAGEAPRAIFKQMSADGWVGLGWPKEWGGKELGPMEQFVFFDESMRAGAPVPMLTINSVAPTIMRFGSEEQKNFYIPKILAGEIHFAIGYTEADAGTDLASLRTRAVRDGDEDVRVPVGNLVGEENQGWSLITNQLNHERVTLCSSGVIERQLHDVREWAQQTLLPDGRRVIDQEWVQLNLARVHAELEFLKLANWRVASNATSGAPLNPADASTIKVFGTEFYMEAARRLLEVLGPAANLRRGSPDAV